MLSSSPTAANAQTATDGAFPENDSIAACLNALADEACLPFSDADFPEGKASKDEADPEQSIKLERRGLTSQTETHTGSFSKTEYQGNFWNKQTIFKNSISAKLRSIGAYEIADGLDHCHSEITYAKCTNCSSVSKFLNRCDRFYCPECQPGLSRQRKEGIEWWTKQISQPKHVCLTVQNTEFLSRTNVQQIKEAFSRLRRTKFAKNWLGGFYSLEVTNEGKGWHLHIHALVNARWIDAGRLAIEWNKATRGQGHIVKVKDCRDKGYLQEVTKYAVKGSDLAKWTPLQILEFIEAFRNIRQFGVFGTLYGLRSEWAEELKKIREARQVCKCGCDKFHFFDEARWELQQAQLVPERKPPEPKKAEHPEFAFLQGFDASNFGSFSR